MEEDFFLSVHIMEYIPVISSFQMSPGKVAVIGRPSRLWISITGIGQATANMPIQEGDIITENLHTRRLASYPTLLGQYPEGRQPRRGSLLQYK